MAKKRANGEGNIRKRKDGRWEGRYTAGYDEKTGKRITKSVLGKTQTEVKEKLAKAVAEAESVDVRRADEYTLGTWLQTWYELYAKPHLRFSTAEYHRRGIELHITPRIGDIPLKKLTGRNSADEPDITRPKTENSIRKISIPQDAVDLLLAEHQKHPGSPWMFPSPKTGEMYHPDSVVNIHKKILKDAGLEHLRFHDLRHTFATLALQNGVDVKTVSSMLGHFDAGFTLRTYTHVTRQMQESAAEKMGNFMAQVM